MKNLSVKIISFAASLICFAFIILIAFIFTKNIFFIACIASFAAYFIIIDGFCNIPLGFKGVVLVLGQRTPIVAPEGIFWIILPGKLMELRSVDAREQVIDLKDFFVTSKNNVQIFIDAFLRYKIKNPSLFLGINENNMKEAMIAKIQLHLREAFRKQTDAQALNKQEKLTERIKKDMQETADFWGIIIISIKLKNVKLDDSLIKEQQRLRQEQLQIAAEKEEFTATIKRAREIQKELGVSGDVAVETVQVGMEKAEKKVVQIRGFDELLKLLVNLLAPK